jgi:hypothetical protein
MNVKHSLSHSQRHATEFKVCTPTPATCKQLLETKSMHHVCGATTQLPAAATAMRLHWLPAS